MQYVAVFVTQYNSSLSSAVPNFRIISQLVAEISDRKKCPYVFYRSDRRKIENLIKEGKMRIRILILQHFWTPHRLLGFWCQMS